MDLHQREWGAGQPVIAMAPLGLESSAFAGLGRTLARYGVAHHRHRSPRVRPDSDSRSTAHAGRAWRSRSSQLARIAAERPPVVLGVSLGGRVALEAALTAPDAFRSVIAIAPLSAVADAFVSLADAARLIDPRIADWIPLEQCVAGAALARPRCSRRRRTSATTSSRRRARASSTSCRCPATRAKRVLGRRARWRSTPRMVRTSLWTRLPSIDGAGRVRVGRARSARLACASRAACARHCPHARAVAPALSRALVERRPSSLPRRGRGAAARRDGCATCRTTPPPAYGPCGPATLELRGCIVGAQSGNPWTPEAVGMRAGVMPVNLDWSSVVGAPPPSASSRLSPSSATCDSSRDPPADGDHEPLLRRRGARPRARTGDAGRCCSSATIPAASLTPDTTVVLRELVPPSRSRDARSSGSRSMPPSASPGSGPRCGRSARCPRAAERGACARRRARRCSSTRAAITRCFRPWTDRDPHRLRRAQGVRRGGAPRACARRARWSRHGGHHSIFILTRGEWLGRALRRGAHPDADLPACPADPVGLVADRVCPACRSRRRSRSRS